MRNKKFDFLINKITKSLGQDKIEEANQIFNNFLRPKFGKDIFKPNNPLGVFVPFYCELDDFFNREDMKILKCTSKEKILELYYSDYKKEVEKILEI